MTKLQDQPPPSPASLAGSVDTHSSLMSSNSDLARVFVRLPDGTKIVVPVPQNASVDQLHQRALQRAARLGRFNDTVLETIGDDPVVLFGEDAVIDVLDLTEDSTFSMRSRESTATLNISTGGGNQAQSSGLGQQQTPSGSYTLPDISRPYPPESKVYVRWITLEAAMENSRLRRIPIDNDPFPCNTTLSDLQTIAHQRLLDGTSRGACTKPTKLNLFLRECFLHTENNLATLRDLGLRGGKHDPLDIFVEFTGPLRPSFHTPSLMATELKDVWSFDSTKRGMSTLITSLQILFKEIGDDRCNIEGILEVLLELTHFPPLLLAFKSLHDTGIGEGISTDPLLMVASAFRALCAKIVPSKICKSSDALLESSRQVVYWIYSIRSEASLSRGSSRPLIHRAHITEGSDPSQLTPLFLPFNAVNVHMKTYLGTEKNSFLVSAETDGQALCEKLGIALNKRFSSPWDFYFQAADNWSVLWDQKLIPTPNANEFDTLIENTNAMDAFKMVGPMQLGACLVAQLPVITLSANGYVSKYEHEDLECSERRFITWNAIEGRVKLPDNPGQFLSQKLDPILLERKKTPNWELDAWPEWTKTADFGTPDEAIIICVDTSSSMNCTMPDGWISNRSALGTNPSRLTEVQEFFKNLALRISALNLSTHLGLLTFDSKIHVKQPLTALHLNFNHQLDNITPGGSTAIFNGLSKAAIMLRDLKAKYPNTKCRIILLTDGEDNESNILPANVSKMLHKNDIVLDAVVIGSSCTEDLFKIAANTGGYAFWPKTQQALFQIFLLETVVDIRTRPDLIREKFTNWDLLKPKKPDMQNSFDFPPCRPHPNLNDYFIALGDAERFLNRMSRSSARSSVASSRMSTASTMTPGTGGISRILLSEIKGMIDNPHEFLDVYVSQSNMGFWKVVMQGPPASPYANGTFLMYVELGADFPRKPPKARFITPILHPNITKHGRVCHPIFDREWTPSTRVFMVLQQLYGILMSLEVSLSCIRIAQRSSDED